MWNFEVQTLESFHVVNIDAAILSVFTFGSHENLTRRAIFRVTGATDSACVLALAGLLGSVDLTELVLVVPAGEGVFFITAAMRFPPAVVSFVADAANVLSSLFLSAG
jgi:hypothetical protein